MTGKGSGTHFRRKVVRTLMGAQAGRLLGLGCSEGHTLGRRGIPLGPGRWGCVKDKEKGGWAPHKYKV